MSRKEKVRNRTDRWWLGEDDFRDLKRNELYFIVICYVRKGIF